MHNSQTFKQTTVGATPVSYEQETVTKIQLTKTAEQKTGKILPGLMSPNFCCDIRMVGSEFGIDLCCQQLRILAVKQQCGESFLGHIGPLRIKQHLNTTAYLSTVADQVNTFLTRWYASSDCCFQQDNTKCHKAQIISNFFLEHEVTVLKELHDVKHESTINHL